MASSFKQQRPVTFDDGALQATAWHDIHRKGMLLFTLCCRLVRCTGITMKLLHRQ
jgi:hypothetical protein